MNVKFPTTGKLILVIHHAATLLNVHNHIFIGGGRIAHCIYAEGSKQWDEDALLH